MHSVAPHSLFLLLLLLFFVVRATISLLPRTVYTYAGERQPRDVCVCVCVITGGAAPKMASLSAHYLCTLCGITTAAAPTTKSVNA